MVLSTMSRVCPVAERIAASSGESMLPAAGPKWLYAAESFAEPSHRLAAAGSIRFK
jgi:hypothetical protein